MQVFNLYSLTKHFVSCLFCAVTSIERGTHLFSFVTVKFQIVVMIVLWLLVLMMVNLFLVTHFEMVKSIKQI